MTWLCVIRLKNNGHCYKCFKGEPGMTDQYFKGAP